MRAQSVAGDTGRDSVYSCVGSVWRGEVCTYILGTRCRQKHSNFLVHLKSISFHNVDTPLPPSTPYPFDPFEGTAFLDVACVRPSVLRFKTSISCHHLNIYWLTCDDLGCGYFIFSWTSLKEHVMSVCLSECVDLRNSS
jgi:hypothetical protein